MLRVFSGYPVMIKNISSSQGLTLLELMIVVAIIGISTSIGMPSMASIIIDTRLSSSANDMLAAVQLARSEAAKKIQYSGVFVSGNTWNVFVGNQSTIVQKYKAASGIILSGTSSTITYRPEGRLNSPTPIVFSFTASGSSASRKLTVSPSGKITITNP